MANINEFKSNFNMGGARTSRFRVKITNPANPAADIDVPFMVKAASLPAKIIRPIELGYFGRKIKVAGPQEFGDWTVRIYNDEDFNIRNALESWMNFMNLSEENINNFGSGDIANYKSLAEVDQMSMTNEVLRTYKFVGVFPTQMSPIGLDWDNEGVEEYDVTFAVDMYYVSGGTTGTAGEA